MAEHRLPDESQYPNNSNKAKVMARRISEGAQEPKKDPVQKVTKGSVRQRKKPLGRRFAEMFGAREGQGVLEYIFQDIIIPATQNMIVDSIIDGAEMAILGEVRGSRRRRPGDRSPRYAYDRVSYRDDLRRDRRDRRDYDDCRPRANMRDYEDIIFDSQADAEEVLSQMIDLIDIYGQVTISDLYDLSGLTLDYPSGNYGWRNLSSASARRIRDGYILALPRAILL